MIIFVKLAPNLSKRKPYPQRPGAVLRALFWLLNKAVLNGWFFYASLKIKEKFDNIDASPPGG